MAELNGSIQFDESGFEADLSKSTLCRSLTDSTQLYVPTNSELIIKKNKGGKKMTIQVILRWCYGSSEKVLNKTFVVRRKEEH